MNKDRTETSNTSASSLPPEKAAPASKSTSKAQCEIVQDLLPLYAEDLVSEPSRKLVESHIKNCPDCKELLKALQEVGNPAPEISDAPMEDAFKKVNQKFHRHHRWLMLLGLLVLMLAIGGGILLSKVLPLSAREIEVSVPVQDEQTISLIIESHFGKMFWTDVKNLGEGRYAISGCSLDISRQLYSNTFTLDKPVNEVSFNNEIIYQDGLVITPRCRDDFEYANGYAGDTGQMKLAMPDFPSYSFHIEANTDTPERCVWDYVLNPGHSGPLEFSEEEKYILRSKALLALALTPNLEEILYSSSDGKTALDISRLQLLEKLKEHGVSERIDSLADLQRIMNIVLPPAG